MSQKAIISNGGQAHPVFNTLISKYAKAEAMLGLPDQEEIIFDGYISSLDVFVSANNGEIEFYDSDNKQIGNTITVYADNYGGATKSERVIYTAPIYVYLIKIISGGTNGDIISLFAIGGK